MHRRRRNPRFGCNLLLIASMACLGILILSLFPPRLVLLCVAVALFFGWLACLHR